MNKEQLIDKLKNRGYSQEVIKAFQEVKREDFVLPKYHEHAYIDDALPLQGRSTISQPSTIAFMLQLLKLDNSKKILEIGSGSGYVLALISQIVPNAQIFGVEIENSLVERSNKILSYNKNIHIEKAGPVLGLPSKAPFERILVSASAPNEGYISPLLLQLSDPGILICPVGNLLIKFKKANSKIYKETFKGFYFVPLV